MAIDRARLVKLAATYLPSTKAPASGREAEARGGQPFTHKGPRQNHSTGQACLAITKVSRRSAAEPNDCTEIGFPLLAGEIGCGTVLGATTLGGFVNITSIGRSWEKGPAVATAPARLARTAIEILPILTMPADFKPDLSQIERGSLTMRDNLQCAAKGPQRRRAGALLELRCRIGMRRGSTHFPPFAFLTSQPSLEPLPAAADLLDRLLYRAGGSPGFLRLVANLES
ncbi:hypothetical protein V1290_000350 [Bradyrhizobium sp. AZCC 1578]